MSDPKPPIGRRPINAWVVGIITSIIATIFWQCMLPIGSYILAILGDDWHGFVDQAYRIAPIVTVEIQYYSLIVFARSLIIVCMWLSFLAFEFNNSPLRNISLIFAGSLSVLTILDFYWNTLLFDRSTVVFETYEQRMMVLTSVFSEEERKVMISEWGGVTSKAGYDKLMNRMEALATKYSITLPKRADQ